MRLNIEIGPYKLVQRTEYSKAGLFNKYTNENLSDRVLAEKILSDYKKQKLHPEDYFIKSEVHKATEHSRL